MFVLICYDIANPRRLRRVARETENFGLRVQDSVFECHLDEAELHELQRRLARLLDPRQDRVRYYRLCAKDVRGIRIDGPGQLTRDWPYAVV